MEAVYIKQLKDFRKQYLAEYKNVVNERYSSRIKEDATPFYLYDDNKVSFLVIYDDSVFFASSKIYSFFYSKINDDDESFILKKFSEYEDLDFYKFSSENSLKQEIFKRITNDDVRNYHEYTSLSLTEVVRSFYTKRNKVELDFTSIMGGAKEKIQQDFTEYYALLNKDNRTLSSIKYDNDYTYTHFDLSSVVDYYKSESLNTVLDQAVFCYKHNKYLAAASTLGVALEEQCVKILELEGANFSWKDDSSLFVVIGQLKNRKIIDNRVAHRLRASSILRNAASHASTGFITKSDCDTIVSSIKELHSVYIKYLKEKEGEVLAEKDVF